MIRDCLAWQLDHAIVGLAVVNGRGIWPRSEADTIAVVTREEYFLDLPHVRHTNRTALEPAQNPPRILSFLSTMN
jgi:hypothetical protein